MNLSGACESRGVWPPPHFEVARSGRHHRGAGLTANLRTEILDFSGFDSSIILILRGGIPRPMGNIPEFSSPGILVGTILAGIFGLSRETGRSPQNFKHITSTTRTNDKHLTIK